jgi:hypothetical protein|nr:MAG TPA: phosphoadenosine-phosphosulfate reductase [Caudoviricetes sp.]
MTLINEEPEGRKTTKVLLAKMSAGALMAFCELLERGDLEQGDELVYVNLGFEWPEQGQAAEALRAICREKLIKFTELQGHLEYEMLHKSIEKLYRPLDASKNLQWQGFVQRLQRGRGWCGGKLRWGESIKWLLINRYLKEQYLKKVAEKQLELHLIFGCTSERSAELTRNRLSVPVLRNFKLINPNIAEGRSKAYCVEWLSRRGWAIGRLYTSGLIKPGCWCCRSRNIKELKLIKQEWPEIWQKLHGLEKLIKEPYYRTPRGWALLQDVNYKATKFTLSNNGNNRKGKEDGK